MKLKVRTILRWDGFFCGRIIERIESDIEAQFYMFFDSLEKYTGAMDLRETLEF